MVAASEAQRLHARTVIAKKLKDAPHFVAYPSLLTPFVELVEQSMFDSRKTADGFRDQLLSIVTNATKLLPTIHEFDPAELGAMHPNDILDRKQRERQEKRTAKRSRETELLDDTRVYCDACGFARRTRLNVNRMGLDSEELGSQYEYNFDNFCQCGEDTIEMKVNRLDDSSSGEDDDVADGTTESSRVRKKLRADMAAGSAHIDPSDSR